MPKLNTNTLRIAGLIAGLAVIIAAALIFTGSSDKKSPSQATDCGPYRKDKLVTINGSSFKAEAPQNQAAFDKGLGGRPCILPDEAMIFPFSKPGQYAFWMKDMKFPIDIIWINANHQVVADNVNLQPSSYPSKYQNPPNLPALYVLEVKADRSKELNIGLGTLVRF